MPGTYPRSFTGVGVRADRGAGSLGPAGESGAVAGLPVSSRRPPGSTRRTLRLAAAPCAGRPAPSRPGTGPLVEQIQPGRGAGREAKRGVDQLHEVGRTSSTGGVQAGLGGLGLAARGRLVVPRSRRWQASSAAQRVTSDAYTQPRSAGPSRGEPGERPQDVAATGRGRRRLQHQEGQSPHAASTGCVPLVAHSLLRNAPAIGRGTDSA
jgi:hypothetical protein